MSDGNSYSKVFTICVDGRVHRMPLDHAFISILEMKARVRQRFNIYYDFDLLYKGAILCPSDSFTDLQIQSAQPLRIRRKGFHPPVMSEPRLEEDGGFGETFLIIRVASLSKVYEVRVPTTATLQELWQSISESFIKDAMYSRSRGTFPLLFNHRMHIFSDVRTERAPLEDFLTMESTFMNDRGPHFFIYGIHELEVQDAYTYQQNPREIFSDSDCWESRELLVRMDRISQTMLLTSLYALQRYFRQPPEDEVHQREVLEAKFLNLVREYLFPPAVLALIHALQGAMFIYEKSILYDGLLKILREFCSISIETSALGTFTPHLFCWLLSKCSQIENEFPPYVNCILVDYDVPDETWDNEVRALSENYSIISSVDFSFMLWQFTGDERYGIALLSDIGSYSILKHNDSSSVDPMRRLEEAELMQLFEMMVVEYPTLVLKTHKDISRNNRTDQLILLQNKQVVLMLRRSRHESDASIGRIFHVFDPLGTRNCITHKDIYHVQRDGSDMKPLHDLVAWSTRLCRVPKSSTPRPKTSLEQITLVLVDVRKTMLGLYREKNESRALLGSIKSMLSTLSDHLYSHRYGHACGLLRLDSQITMLCPITQDAYPFDKAIDNLQYEEQDSSRLNEAITIGIDHMIAYQQSECLGNEKPHKLIICITNGINDDGSVNFRTLQQKAKRRKIKVDMISFLSDTRQLKNSEERIEVQRMKRLCEDTRGFIYQTKYFSTPELRSIFAQRATLWINERANNGISTGKYPTPKIPDEVRT